MVNNNEGVTMILKNEKGVAVMAKENALAPSFMFFLFCFP